MIRTLSARRFLPITLFLFALAVSVYISWQFDLPTRFLQGSDAFALSIPIILLAFGCEFVDSSLGMGYGTTLTPLLLAFGYEPGVIVPAVLFSEFVTGLTAGAFHHGFGNVNFRPGTRDMKVVLLMTALSVLGAVMAVALAVNLPAFIVKLYIGLLVLGIGLWILRNHHREAPFSWKRIAGLGFLAAFNKGISGGGYGPVVTGGQMLAGIRGQAAIGIASFAEGVTSLVGVIAYLIGGALFPWNLAPSLLLGAILSVPLAAFTVSRISTRWLTLAIGVITVILGSYTLINLL